MGLQEQQNLGAQTSSSLRLTDAPGIHICRLSVHDPPQTYRTPHVSMQQDATGMSADDALMTWSGKQQSALVLVLLFGRLPGAIYLVCLLQLKTCEQKSTTEP